jgi:hypothetical protein
MRKTQASIVQYVSVHFVCVLFVEYGSMRRMKRSVVQVRIEPCLKRSFFSAARFSHQSLSQFLVQAGLVAVDQYRARGLKIKVPPKPRDCRRRLVVEPQAASEGLAQ